MAAPTIGTATSASGTSSGATSLTITKPTGVAEGDLLIAAFSASSGRFFNTLSGWTALTSQTIDSYDTRTFAKVATAADVSATDYTWALSSSFANPYMGLMACVDGAADIAGNAIENAGGTGTTSGTATVPTVTPSDADSLVIGVVGLSNNDGQTVTGFGSGETAVPSGTVSAGGGAMGMGYRTHGASATGTQNYTTSGFARWSGHRLAIAPSGGGTKGFPFRKTKMQFRNRRVA